MSRGRALVVAACCLAAPIAAGSVPELTSLDVPVAWTDPTLEIRLTGPTIVDLTLVHGFVTAAATDWSSIAHSRIELTTTPSPDAPEPVSGNSLNEYGWIETTDHPWVGPAAPCSTVTVTVAATGERLEADTWCNAASFTWQEDELDGAYHPGLIDPRRAALHELGHWLGLDHTLLYGELMDPRVLFGATAAGVGSLESSFARARYPAGTSPHGSIAGHVSRAGAGVPYAYVLAVERSTGKLYGAVAGADGFYRVEEVPAGSYRLLVRPLTTDPVLGSPAYRESPPASLEFLATLHPGAPIELAPGEVRERVDVAVAPLFGPDPWEPDGDTETATSLEAGAFQLHHLDSALDRDVFGFTTTPGRCVTFHTELTGASTASADPELFWARTRIEARDGPQVIANDSRDPLRDDPRSWVTWCETGAGRELRIEVGPRMEAGGPGYSYALAATEIDPAAGGPLVGALVPGSAFEGDEEVVMIHGQGFVPGARVEVERDGWHEASFVAVAGCDPAMRCTRIAARFPGLAAGPAAVRVTNPDGSSSTHAGGPPGGFEYVARPAASFANASGLGLGYLPGGSNGVCIGDLDRDGLDDIVRPLNSTNGDAVFRNDGDGTFTDVSAAWGIAPPPALRHESCALADVEGDGDLDVFMVHVADSCEPAANRLFVNRLAETGSVSFALEPGARGLGGQASRLKADAAFADFDRDGDLDAVLAYDAHACGGGGPALELFRQRSDGTFDDVSSMAGLPATSLGATSVHWADFDGDMAPDLLVNAAFGEPGLHLEGLGDGTFVDRTAGSGLETEWCAIVALADLDNDGDVDVFCGTPAAGPGGIPPRLWLNDGTGRFTDVAAEAGLDALERNVTAATALDFDNDGCEDLYLGASWVGWPNDLRDVLLRNDCHDGSPHFTDVTALAGVDPHPWHRDVMGVAAFDSLGDGALDVYASGFSWWLAEPQYDGDSFWHSRLNFSGPQDDPFENVNTWLDVRLSGGWSPGASGLSNRDGIGAKVIVVTSYSGSAAPSDAECVARPLPDGSEHVAREVLGGSRSQGPTGVHLGLGGLEEVFPACLVVQWPSGLRRNYRGIPYDSRVVLREAAAGLEVVRTIPDSGPNTSSPPVRVVGFDFELAGGTPPAVLFGAVPALSVAWLSENELVALPPLLHPPGTVDVTVENPDGESDALLAGYTFLGEDDSTGFIRIKDPVPSILAGGSAVPNDPLFVARHGNEDERTGVIADGVTELVLELELLGPGSVHFLLDDDEVPENRAPAATDVGTLEPLDRTNTGTGIVVPAHPLPDGRVVAHAVYRAPLSFIRGPADEPLGERPVHIAATWIPAAGEPLPIDGRVLALHRVPILFVGGIWSKADSIRWPMMTDPRWITHHADYRQTSARSFGENAPVPPNALRELRDLVRERGIAATRFFVFAHSMGGVLFRIFMSETGAPYRRPDNFMAGDVHALVTSATPHFGSNLADVFWQASRTPLGPSLIALSRWLEMDISQGGVASLRTASPDTLGMRVTPGRFHVITAWGGQEMRQLGIGIAGAHPRLRAIEKLLALTSRAYEDVFLACDDGDDFVVCTVSQQGGLDPPFESDFHHVGAGARAIHLESIAWEEAPSLRAIELVNAPVTDETVWASELPAVASVSPWAGEAATSSGPTGVGLPEAERAAVAIGPAGGPVELVPLAPAESSGEATLWLGKSGADVVLSWIGAPARLLKATSATLAGAACLAVAGSSHTDAGAALAPAPFFYRLAGAAACLPAADAPAVAAISPGAGHALGGYGATIVGSGFAAGASVAFGGSPAGSVAVLGPSTITCTVPPGQPGTATVAVSNPTGGTAQASFSYVEPQAAEGGVEIAAPVEGAVVVAGTPLVVRATGTDGFVIAAAFAYADAGSLIDDADDDPGPGFSTTLDLPLEFIGTLRIGLIARDAAGRLVTASPVTVSVVAPPGASPEFLVAERLVLLAGTPVRQLHVFAVDAAGMRREVTRVPGVTYFIAPPAPDSPDSGTAIATVDEQGLVTARAVGKTLCHVGHAGLSEDVVVEVKEMAPTLTLAGGAGSTALRLTSQGMGRTYDVVRGSLSALRASAGDFTAATATCLADEMTGLTATDAAVPAPGEGFFYLTRDSYAQTYDTAPYWPATRQEEIRTAEINAAGTCAP